MGRERIEKVFQELQAKGKKALITYITAGDPDLSTTVALVKELAASGADIIELGVPFSDPVADGPVIQLASQRALGSGTNLAGILETVKTIRAECDVPLVLMTYLNPIFRMGVEKFSQLAAEAGVDGVIIPDLPKEEFAFAIEPVKRAGLAFIPLVAPTTPLARVASIAAEGSGFLYAVSLTGVTGDRDALPEGVSEFLEGLRGATSLPVAVGFGISRPEQAQVLKDSCDGVIVGSAYVKMVAKINEDPSVISKIKDLTAGFKEVL